jgi:hypothetical protein
LYTNFTVEATATSLFPHASAICAACKVDHLLDSLPEDELYVLL